MIKQIIILNEYRRGKAKLCQGGEVPYVFYLDSFLFLYESTLLRNWNHSNRIIQTKVMAFSCQTNQFTDYTRDSLYHSFFFRGLKFMFDSSSLYSIKSKVLRVLLQLESPNSEHRDSSYVQNNPDYSMIKTKTRIWLAHGPTLSEFLGHVEPEFDDAFFSMFRSP